MGARFGDFSRVAGGGGGSGVSVGSGGGSGGVESPLTRLWMEASGTVALSRWGGASAISAGSEAAVE